MLRKTTATVVLAGALALGTASATSLGTFDDVSFAASPIGLENCQVTTGVLDLVPSIPTDGEASTSLGDTSFLLDTVDLSLLGNLPPECTGTTADVAIVGTSTVIDVFQVDLATVADLTSVSPDLTTIDVADVTEVRIVVHDG